MERSVVLRLMADVSDLKRKMGEATKAVGAVGPEAEVASKKATKALGDAAAASKTVGTEAQTAAEKTRTAGDTTEKASAKVKKSSDDAAVAAREAAAAQKEAAKAAEEEAEAWVTLGEALSVAGGLTVGALGASAAAAISWESAFAGVRKTINGTPEQLAAIEGGLRDMSTQLPATQGELAAVAEAAGALGVETPAVMAFTRTMIDLGETTDLSADQAANALARLANIMGTDVETEIDKLGATLVELGNNGASTEGEITEMALRIAGAGRQIGLSEADVLGYASALSSVGIEAEAGGSAISRVFIDIAQAARNGGASLDTFSRVAGMSTSDFRRAFEEDAGGAVASFIEGLGRLQVSGGDTFGVLDDLGLSEIRVRDALLRSAAAGDLLTESLNTGARAWEENTALTDEANQRYQTTEAILATASNSFRDAGIAIGSVFLPAIAAGAEDLGTLLSAVKDLPDPVLEIGGALAGVAGSAALVGGAYLVAAPKISAGVTALAATGPAGASAAAGLRAAWSAAGPLALAISAIAAVGVLAGDGWVAQQQAVDNYRESLDQATAAITDQTRVLAVQSLQKAGAYEAARELGIAEDLVTDAALRDVDARRELNTELGRYLRPAKDFQQAQADTNALMADGLGLTESGADAAQLLATSVGVSSKRLSESIVEQEEFIRGMGGVTSTQERAAAAMQLLTGRTEDYAAGLQIVAPSTEGASRAIAGIGDVTDWTTDQIDEAVEALDKQLEAYADLSAGIVEPLSVYREALQAKEDKEREAAQATADATEDSSDSWKDYVSETSLSLDEYAAKLEEKVIAQEQWRANIVQVTEWAGEEVGQALFNMKEGGIELTAQMVDGSSAEAQRLAGLLERDIGFAGDAANAEFDLAMKALQAKAAAGGTITASELSRTLGLGVAEVERIAAQYGIELAEGINPVIRALGREGITLSGASGRDNKAMADGGFHEDHRAHIAPGGTWRTFAEPETGGEAYIPLSPAKRARSLNIWEETGRRLGIPVNAPLGEAYAAGGFSGVDDVPGVPSVAPYKVPIGTAATAAMTRAYDDVRAWMEQNAGTLTGPTGEPVVIPPGGGKDLVGIGRLLQSMGARVTEHPAFGGVNFRHSPTSLHYKGRAIDVNYGPGGANATENAFMRQVIPQLRQMASFRQLYYREIGGRTDHDDHLHLGMDRGGIVDMSAPKGSMVNPHVRDHGGPLLQGYTLNATGGQETVVRDQRVFDAGPGPTITTATQAAPAPVVFPKSLTLRIGDREFEAYVGDVSSDRRRHDGRMYQGAN